MDVIVSAEHTDHVGMELFQEEMAREKSMYIDTNTFIRSFFDINSKCILGKNFPDVASYTDSHLKYTLTRDLHINE